MSKGGNMSIRIYFLLLVASLVNLSLESYDCIKQCSCERRGTKLIANCSSANLTTVLQPDEDYHINVLHVEYNLMEALTPDHFESFHDLIELYARDNEISTIEPGVFNSSGSPSNSSLKSLVILDLPGNSLKNLPDGMFSDLHNLTTLVLNRNPLSKISSKTFAGLYSLKILQLEQSNISVIHDGAFEDLKSLEKLHLEKNKLKDFPNVAFQSLTHLDISHNYLTTIPNIASRKLINIDYSWNKFENLDIGSFSGTPNLQYLYLGHCKLGYINYNVFSKTSSLVYLDLTANRITNFPNLKMPALQYLLLEENQIQAITKNLSDVVPRIMTLNLGDNNIEYLDAKVFDSVLLEGVNLSVNPFQCKCKLLGFADWLEQNNDIVQNGDYILCQAPLPSFAEPVQSFMKTLNCDDVEPPTARKSNFYLIVSIVVLLLSFLLILIMLVLCKKSKQNAQRRHESEDTTVSDNGDIRLMSSKGLCASCEISCHYTNCFKFGMPGRDRVFSEEMRDLMIASPVTSPIDKDAPTSL